MRSECSVDARLRLGAEALGTALLVFGALSAIALHLGDPLTGALVGVVVALIAASPLGSLSGAHLNPAVTLAFRIEGAICARDAVGYVLAQVAGALASASVFGALVGRGPGDVTHPSVSPATAFVLEAAMTAALIAVILALLARARLERFTPLGVLVTLAGLIWVGGRLTGTSLNPARSAGPAIAFGDFADLWLYLVAPLAGALGVGVVGRNARPDRGTQGARAAVPAPH